MAIRSVRRMAAIATGAALAAGMATYVPQAFASTKESAVSTPGTPAFLAIEAARDSGDRVEDESQRTETTQVFANPDGTWTAEIASEPVRVQDSSGDWHDIDLTLVERDGALAPRHGFADVRLSDGGDKTFVQLSDSDTSSDLAWRWGTALPEPTVDGATATYADVVPGGDLVVTATSTGFSHSVVLRERPADAAAAADVASVSVPIVTDGGKLAETSEGAIQIKTSEGEVVAAAPEPVMWDAATDSQGDPVNVVPVDTTITPPSGSLPDGGQAGGSPVMTLSASEEFLLDPATAYPVTIDPTFSVVADGDTWMYNQGETNSHGGSEELRVGTNDGGSTMARSFLSFDQAPFEGKDVTDATLRLFNFYSGSCTQTEIQAARIMETWSSASVSWTTQPSVSTQYVGVYWGAKGFNSSCTGGNADFDVKTIVRGWALGSWPNYGLRLRALTESSSNASWRRYRSINYSAAPDKHPKLIVDYAVPPSTPVIGVTPCPDCDPEYLFTNSLTPTLTAVSSDSDTGTLNYSWQVREHESGSVVHTASTSAAQGTASTVAIPSGVLQDEISYQVLVETSDGRTTASSGWKDLGVDANAAPVAPSAVALSPCVGSCGSLISSSTTPTLSATVADPDSDIVESIFEIRQQGQTTVLAASDEATVASGSTASYVVPGSVLVNQGSYEFRVGATDGSTTWNSWTPFSVQVPSGTAAPTSLTLVNCLDACGEWISTTTQPQFSVVNPTSNGVRTVRFEVSNSEYLTSGDVSVTAGGTGNWTVPANEVGAGTKWQVRAGAVDGQSVVWSGWVPFVVGPQAVSTSGFPVSELDAEDLSVPAANPEEDGAGVSASQAQTEWLDGQQEVADDDTGSSFRQASPYLDSARTVSRARQFAPFLRFHHDEAYGPMNAKTFINDSVLQWKHHCGNHTIDATVDASKLSSSTTPYKHSRGNLFASTSSCPLTYDNNYLVPSTDLVRPFDALYPIPPGEGMHLNLDNGSRDGYGFQRDEEMYYQQYNRQTAAGERTYIIYWFHWGYSLTLKAFGHEGDWESIGIEFVSATGKPSRVAYSYHHTGCTLPWKDVPKSSNGYNPEVWTTKNAHGSYPAGGGTYGGDQISGVGNVWWPNHLKQAPLQDWYGYGGAWGAAGSIPDFTGPSGPSQYKYQAKFGKGRCEGF